MGCVRRNDRKARSLNLQAMTGKALMSEDGYNKETKCSIF